MQETSTIARPYALAAFMQAEREGKLAEWSEMLALLGQVVRDPTMTGLIASPRISDDQLVGLIVDVCGDRLSETGRNFVRLLAEKDRLSLVPLIRDIFDRERARSEGRSRIEVISAFELDDRQQKTIATAMSKRLGTEVDLSTRVDKSLIGGVLIRAGDLVIDASLRGRLERLGTALA